MISSSISEGSSVGPKRRTTLPSLSTRNFVKFHFIKPFSLEAPGILEMAVIAALFLRPFGLGSSGWASFRKVNNGSALSPLTSTLASWSNFVSYFRVQKLRISSIEPGAWWPN